MSKRDVASLMSQLREADISLNMDVRNGGLRQTSRALAQVHFETKSPCRDVSVWLRGNGHLEELIIADGALDRHDDKEIAELITQTLQRAETTMRQALQAMNRGQNRKEGS